MTAFLPMLLFTLPAAAVLGALHFFLIYRNRSKGSEALLPRQLMLLLLTLVIIITAIALSPVTESTRNQILGLMGIVISGVIAFSSTTFVVNFMAAVMLRVTQPFKVGDFIRVGEYFGKVAQRGIFDTEIQIESRELIAIPNVTFINEPVAVARRSGIIISTTLSLGYDLSHAEVEPLMIKAAESAGLKAPFVHVMQLGDFSVSYKVSGLLEDVERILTVRSDLNRQLLDTIHDAGLEIVSPNIVRHITHSADALILPEKIALAKKVNTKEAEAIVFDKARANEELESVKARLTEKLADKNSLEKKEAQRVAAELQALQEKQKQLDEES